jgi:hypothetical protein
VHASDKYAEKVHTKFHPLKNWLKNRIFLFIHRAELDAIYIYDIMNMQTKLRPSLREPVPGQAHPIPFALSANLNRDSVPPLLRPSP